MKKHLIFIFILSNLIFNTQASSYSKNILSFLGNLIFKTQANSDKDVVKESIASKVFNKELQKYLPIALIPLITKYTQANFILCSTIPGASDPLLAPGTKCGYKPSRLIKYLEDGQIDNSFGSKGIVNTDFSRIFSAYLHNDKTIALGKKRIMEEGSKDYLYEKTYLARYNNDGKLDQSFGDKGIVEIEMAAESNCILDINGNIIIYQRDGCDTTLIKYNSNGNLDFQFSKNEVTGLPVVQPDGKIIFFGTDPRPTFTNINICRLLDDGTLDKTYANQGLANSVTTGVLSTDSIFLQNNNKILVGCLLRNLQLNLASPILVQYLENGTLDSNFGNDKERYPGFAFVNFRIAKINTLTDGKILIAGIEQIDRNNARIRIIRLFDNGIIDSSFNADNDLEKMVQANPNKFDGLWSGHSKIQILNQVYDKIVLGGTDGLGITFLFRFNNDGSLDNTFHAQVFPDKIF